MLFWLSCFLTNSPKQCLQLLRIAAFGLYVSILVKHMLDDKARQVPL